MRKIKTAIISLLTCFSAVADTKLEFRGVLTADPCQISTDFERQEINFPAIASKTFINNPRSLPKVFFIQLKECDLSLGKSVKVTFDGERDQQQDAFSVTGGAKGVAIVLEDNEGKTIKPGVAMRPESLQSEDTTLEFRAYVQAKSFSEVEEGPFESIVTFTLQYE